MTKTAYVNVRIDQELKVESERVLNQVGVSTSEAITMFFRQVILRRGIPFDVCIPNAATRKAMAELDAGGGTVYTGSTAEAFDAMLGRNAKRRA